MPMWICCTTPHMPGYCAEVMMFLETPLPTELSVSGPPTAKRYCVV